jgi:hypothetical protein
MAGFTFVSALIYLTLLVSFVISYLEVDLGRELVGKTLHRWGKFSLLLVVLGAIIQVMSFFQ